MSIWLDWKRKNLWHTRGCGSGIGLFTDRDLAKLDPTWGAAKATYKGSKVQAFAEVARAFEVGAAGTVSPYLGLAHTWLHTDAAKERGSALLPLDVKAQSDSALQSTLGVRAAYRLPTATPVSVTANLGWTHAFNKGAVKTSNRFAVGANEERMSVTGTRLDKDRALVGVGVEAQITPRATLTLSYDGQFGAHDKTHAGNVQFKLRF